MSLLTTIDGMPLYTTKQEALEWVDAYNGNRWVVNKLSGYHAHDFQGKVGYMGGATHTTTQESVVPTPTPVSISTPTTQPTQTTPTPPIDRETTGGGY
tara:strand:+ start:232 stop:525 length:294 start_codon:yes stop_codon:yes gene_type:complete